MSVMELDRALNQLRLGGGMAAVLETRLRKAQAEAMAPIDLLASSVPETRFLPRQLRQSAPQLLVAAARLIAIAADRRRQQPEDRRLLPHV